MTPRIPAPYDGQRGTLDILRLCKICGHTCKRVPSGEAYPVWVHVSVTAWLNNPHTAEV